MYLCTMLVQQAIKYDLLKPQMSRWAQTQSRWEGIVMDSSLLLDVLASNDIATVWSDYQLLDSEINHFR